ncbi:MAG: ribosomal RNA small subunit methyltransferase A [SAR324 cluster bacterium]|nr:ribosomal RNA small subunit methyltransferase A [SAR324 cluster bacterium]
MPKKWGQHFLIQQQYVDRLVQAAHISEEDNILEIGPGRGDLTRALLKKKILVTAIEVDSDLVKLLTRHFAGEDRFTLIHQDILQCENSILKAIFPNPYKVVANLPYNISAPIFYKLFEIRRHLKSITVMVQKEVALRICAGVTERKSYGVLSIAAEIGFERTLVSSIPPSAFSPPPKVESAIVHLTPKPRVFSGEEEPLFLKWIQAIFNQRRKTLLNNLQRCSPDAFTMKEARLREKYSQKRAETLNAHELIELFRFMQAAT